MNIDASEKVNIRKTNSKLSVIPVNTKTEIVLNKINENKNCPCSVNQLLAIIIPISLALIFIIVFLSVYFTKDRYKNKLVYINSSIINNNNITNTNLIKEYDEFTIIVSNISYATLTPIKGYDHIYIHLGGIGANAGHCKDFFRSNKTFIPKGTKIYCLSGELRLTKFTENSVTGFNKPKPSWFNVDRKGNLICANCGSDKFYEAKKSLNWILDRIDQISIEENIHYNRIYLGGFSQGGIMTNYVLLNSRHKLGGYLIFSGYVFDHHFPPNYVVTELNDEQKQILKSKKDYHILATHSFNDNTVFYSKIIEGYYTYYKDYTDFTLLGFGNVGHKFDTQPTHEIVRKWLKKSYEQNK